MLSGPAGQGLIVDAHMVAALLQWQRIQLNRRQHRNAEIQGRAFSCACRVARITAALISTRAEAASTITIGRNQALRARLLIVVSLEIILPLGVPLALAPVMLPEDGRPSVRKHHDRGAVVDAFPPPPPSTGCAPS